jgi:hypothetical protein
MSVQKNGPDAARSRLRTTVATIEREIARLKKDGASGDDKSPLDGLIAPWGELVAQLALGPEPEVRECPSCSGIGIREATLCGFCWTKLEPPPRDGAKGTKR